jgi:hypothetical protein
LAALNPWRDFNLRICLLVSRREAGFPGPFLAVGYIRQRQ